MEGSRHDGSEQAPEVPEDEEMYKKNQIFFLFPQTQLQIFGKHFSIIVEPCNTEITQHV